MSIQHDSDIWVFFCQDKTIVGEQGGMTWIFQDKIRSTSTSVRLTSWLRKQELADLSVAQMYLWSSDWMSDAVSLQKQLMIIYSTSQLTPTSPFQRREEKHTSGQVGQILVLTVTAETKCYHFSHQLKKKKIFLMEINSVSSRRICLREIREMNVNSL